MGIKIIGYKYVRKEAGAIHTIQKVFEGISMKRQFSTGLYRIDFYFPCHKLAIEREEHDHKDRDVEYETRRQNFIEDQLNYKFIRYNPDAKDFTIERVLNKIFQYLSYVLHIIFVASTTGYKNVSNTPTGPCLEINTDLTRTPRPIIKMSLELFHKVSAGAVEPLFDEQNQTLFKRADLRKYLGIEKIKHNFKDFP